MSGRGALFVAAAVLVAWMLGLGAVVRDLDRRVEAQARAEAGVAAGLAADAGRAVLGATGSDAHAAAVSLHVAQGSAGLAGPLATVDAEREMDDAGALAWRVRVRGTASEVVGAATRASSVHAVVAVEASRGWTPRGFAQLRAGLLALLGRMGHAPHEDDRVGLVLFGGGFAWEVTPLQRIAEERLHARISARWKGLERLSRAGLRGGRAGGCLPHVGQRLDDFLRPRGGCYPTMPRLYSDETGVDPAPALDLARRMLSEVDGGTPGTRALLVVAATGVAEVPETTGRARARQRYAEQRMRESLVTGPRSSARIVREAVDAARRLATGAQVATSVLGVGDGRGFVPGLAQGGGVSLDSPDAGALSDMLSQVADRWPLERVP
jgi:hypothetical protein